MMRDDDDADEHLGEAELLERRLQRADQHLRLNRRQHRADGQQRRPPPPSSDRLVVRRAAGRRPEQIALRGERVDQAAGVGDDQHDRAARSSGDRSPAGAPRGVPYSDRSNTAGMTSATTARNSIAEVLVAAVRLNFCERRPSPPTKNESPSTSSRLPMMLPVIDALTSSTWPWPSATTAMISSAALPKVAFRKPPSAGPERVGEFLGAEADHAGERDQRHRGSEEDPRRVRRDRGQHPRQRREHDEQVQPVGGERRRAQRGSASRSVGEAFEVFVVCAGQQIEEGVEAAVERAAKLRDGAVEGVQRDAGVGAVGERRLSRRRAPSASLRESGADRRPGCSEP